MVPAAIMNEVGAITHRLAKPTLLAGRAPRKRPVSFSAEDRGYRGSSVSTEMGSVQ
jgi:hypothetical protein